MYVLYFIAIVILIIVAVNQNRELKAYKNELDVIHQRLRTLYGRTEYNYEKIKHLSGNTKRQPTDEQVSPSHVTHQAENPPVQQDSGADTHNTYAQRGSCNPYISNADRRSEPIFKDINQTYKTSYYPVSAQTNTHSEIQKTEQNTQPMQAKASEQSTQPEQEYESIQNTQPIQAQEFVQNTQNVQSNEPVQNTQTSYFNEPAAKKNWFGGDRFKNFENWFGTRVFNVVASLLVFIGLILFGTLSYASLSDFAKVSVMFAVSGAVIAFGSVLSKKNKSVFSLGLTGCGLGALFISILLSHIYFKIMSDIPALILLLIWGIFAIVMSKIFESTIISITAHLGMAVSVCISFGLGFTPDKIAFLVVYQIASILVIIFGNIFFTKKTYRFGLFVSMGLFVYSTAVMIAHFNTAELYLLGLSNAAYLILFAVQTIGISFVSYLLAVSTTKLSPDENDQKLLKIQFSIHTVNKVLWAVGVYLSVGLSLSILANGTESQSDIPAVLSLFAVAAAHLAVTVFITEKLNFSERLSKISCWVCSGIIVICLIAFGELRTVLEGFPFLFVYAFVLMLVIKYTKTKKLNHLISSVLIVDMVYMVCEGYHICTRHGSLVVAVLYTLAVGVAVLFHWFIQSGESKQKRFMLFKLTEYLWFSVSSICILVSSKLTLGHGLFTSILIALSIINILAYLTNYTGKGFNYLKITVVSGTILTLCMSYSMIAYPFPISETVSEIILRISLTVLCAVLLFAVVRDFTKLKFYIVHLISALAIALYFTALSSGLRHISYVAEIYSDILSGRPFFFVLAVTLLILYKLTKDRSLELFVMISLGIDMFLMVVAGYIDLADEGLVLLNILYCAVTCGIMFCLWYLKPEEERKRSLLIFKTVGYIWLHISAFVICLTAFDGSGVSLEIALVVVSAADVAAYAIKYSGKETNYLSIIIEVLSVITLYVNFCEMSVYVSSLGEHYVLSLVVRIMLIMVSAALYICYIYGYVKSNSVIKQIFAGITLTILTLTACSGVSYAASIAYVFSAICMLTALVCVIIGFKLQAKGIRLYGLVVIMISVIKMVTVDINSANSMARVGAFIIGGIICFAISGFYNRFEKIYAEKNVVNQQVGAGAENIPINDSTDKGE